MAAGRKTGGRIKGVPNKATADVKEAARAFTTDALEALASIMRVSESDAARVSAANALLDRAYGKPAQALDVDARMAATIVIKTGVPRAHRGD